MAFSMAEARQDREKRTRQIQREEERRKRAKEKAEAFLSSVRRRGYGIISEQNADGSFRNPDWYEEVDNVIEHASSKEFAWNSDWYEKSQFKIAVRR